MKFLSNFLFRLSVEARRLERRLSRVNDSRGSYIDTLSILEIEQRLQIPLAEYAGRVEAIKEKVHEAIDQSPLGQLVRGVLSDEKVPPLDREGWKDLMKRWSKEWAPTATETP